MSRRECPFQLRVEQQQTSQLANHGARLQSEEFLLRVNGDHLTAQWPSSGLYDSPPQLNARIEHGPDGVVITGTVRESFNDAMWQPAFLGLTVFMGLLAAFGLFTLITGSSGGLPPLLIGLITAPLFLLLWRRAKRNRQPNFDLGVRELSSAMHELLSTGTASRFAL